MSRRVPIVALALSLTLALLPAQGAATLKSGAPVPEGAVAVVDGTSIPLELFVDEMASRFLRPGAEGHKVLETLEHEALIAGTLAERGLSITDDEVDAKVKTLADEVKAKSNRSLEDWCQESGVSLAVFREKTRGVVALEKIARAEMRVPDDKPVTPLEMNLWLRQAREQAKIERDPAKLPRSAVAMVNSTPVEKLAFVRHLLVTLDRNEVRKNAETLVQEIVVDRLLASKGVTLTDADIQAEWAFKKKEFESDPLHAGIRFEDIVRQQTGLGPEAFQATRGFRINAGLARFGQVALGDVELQDAYVRHQSVFGPRYHVRHILVRASDHANLKGKIRTYQEGEELARFIVAKLKEGVPFEDLVRQYSEDTGTRNSGGAIPPFTPGKHNYEPALVEAVYRLKPTEISEPVRGQNGWHVIRLERMDPAPALATVEPELRRLIASERFRDEYTRSSVGFDLTRLAR